MDGTTRWFGPISGVLAVAAVVVGEGISGEIDAEPSDSARTVLIELRAKAEDIELGVLFSMLAVGLLLIYVAHATARLAEAGAGWTAHAVALGVLVGVLALMPWCDAERPPVRSLPQMLLARSLLAVSLLAVGGAACSGDGAPGPEWAIVKVEILDGPSLTAICIDSACREFDPAADVRSGEFSAFVQPDTTFEVLRVGEELGEGARGGSSIGGCMLLELTTDSANFIGGCNVAPGGG